MMLPTTRRPNTDPCHNPSTKNQSNDTNYNHP